MSHLIGTTLARGRMQTLETLHCYVLHTLFPLPGYIDAQCSDFLKLWMDSISFGKFSDLIKYCTTIGNSTLIK